MPNPQNSQDDLYKDAIESYSAAIVRLARAWEADEDIRQDLLQEIHLALWRSMANFNSRCSLRTWIYRVAHNAAASHVLRSRRMKLKTMISLEEIEEPSGPMAEGGLTHSLEQAQILDQLYTLIHRLNPLDRQVVLLYLEGMDAASIGEITGISSGYAATKIHRIKGILADRFRNGENHEQR